MENSVSSVIKISKPHLYIHKLWLKRHTDTFPQNNGLQILFFNLSECSFTFCTVFCVQIFHISRERITCNKIPCITILGSLHLYPWYLKKSFQTNHVEISMQKLQTKTFKEPKLKRPLCEFTQSCLVPTRLLQPSSP